MSLPTNVLRSEAVVLHYHWSGRRRAEGVYPNDGDPVADKGLPSDRRTSLNDQDWHIRGENSFPVIVRLRSEQVCTWHTHHSRVNASRSEPFTTLKRQMNF
jgi:hypothetical protein